MGDEDTCTKPHGHAPDCPIASIGNSNVSASVQQYRYSTTDQYLTKYSRFLCGLILTKENCSQEPKFASSSGRLRQTVNPKLCEPWASKALSPLNALRLEPVSPKPTPEGLSCHRRIRSPLPWMCHQLVLQWSSELRVLGCAVYFFGIRGFKGVVGFALTAPPPPKKSTLVKDTVSVS